ncbi:MAG: DUF2179 domain-containing protein [Anaerolineales bacterium]|nr:DUF2179 domain-containing protein [Anaerolineales bacterium]
MDFVFSSSTLLGAGLIFILRVLNMSLDTIRIMFSVRNKKTMTFILGFIQTIIYVVVLQQVLESLDNLLNILAYAAGFSIGNVFGMWLGEKLAVGQIDIRIITAENPVGLIKTLRDENYAVTEIKAKGKEGKVTVLLVCVNRKHVPNVREIVERVSPDAFMTEDEMGHTAHGYWRL